MDHQIAPYDCHYGSRLTGPTKLCYQCSRLRYKFYHCSHTASCEVCLLLAPALVLLHNGVGLEAGSIRYSNRPLTLETLMLTSYFFYFLPEEPNRIKSPQHQWPAEPIATPQSPEFRCQGRVSASLLLDRAWAEEGNAFLLGPAQFWSREDFSQLSRNKGFKLKDAYKKGSVYITLC